MWLSFGVSAQSTGTANTKSVLIGFDGTFTQPTSTSARAIELGAQVAIDEINARGGVLGGRPLKLATTDNHGISARARDNFEELAAMPDLTFFQAPVFLAFFLNMRWLVGGKYMPLVSVQASVFASFRMFPTVIASLVKPFGTPFQVTPKGSSSVSGRGATVF